MKILFFSPYFYPYLSGLTIYPQRLLNYLSQKHQITILTFHPQRYSVINNHQLKIVTLPYLLRFSKGFISPQSWLWFLKYARKTDLIILNQPNFEGLPLAIFGRLLGKKIISIVHCQVFLPKTLLNILANFFLNLSFYLQLWLSTVIIPTTQDYADSLLFGRVFKNKIKPCLPPVRPPPVLLQFNIKLEQEKKGIWIGYVGRIAAEKGIEYLIQAVKELKVKHKYKNLELVFAGPADETVGEKKYLQFINRQLAINHIKYRFLGKLTEDQLGAFYKNIDILVLPSINQTEALGIVQIEAMLLGTPVIATNLPGVRMPVKLTKMGIIVQPKNPEQLTNAIIAILNNKTKYTNLVLIEKAKKIFNEKKTYQFYDKLLNYYPLMPTS